MMGGALRVLASPAVAAWRVARLVAGFGTGRVEGGGDGEVVLRDEAGEVVTVGCKSAGEHARQVIAFALREMLRHFRSTHFREC